MKKEKQQLIIPFIGLKEGIHQFEFEIDSTFFEQFDYSIIKDADFVITHPKGYELDKEIIFKSIYDDEEYNDSKLRFVLNRLGLAIKEFVVHAEIIKENVFTEKVWVDFLLKKKQILQP